MQMEKKYVSPFIEVIEVEVEEGFAISTQATVSGQVNNFVTSGFDGGSSTRDF